MRKKILVCVGTRPNLIKITRLEEAFSNFPDLEYRLLHTGQHYDDAMNKVFFDELGIRHPDIQFTLQPGGQIAVLTQIMSKFEEVCKTEKPDMVMVPWDVNSSLACALVAARMNIPVAHIESGLRSHDFEMPEEQNRILIDAISQLFFVTEQSGQNNLIKDGHSQHQIVFSGNTMIDSLVHYMPKIDAAELPSEIGQSPYVLMTFHRPANVDDPKNLKTLVEIIQTLSKNQKVVFPIHPRTRKNLQSLGWSDELSNNNNIVFSPPLGYFSFIKLVKNALAVITDSGGIQEETTFLKVPCITVRTTTERPVTIEEGTNELSDLNAKVILDKMSRIEKGTYKKGLTPALWDGNASVRIAEAIHQFFN